MQHSLNGKTVELKRAVKKEEMGGGGMYGEAGYGGGSYGGGGYGGGGVGPMRGGGGRHPSERLALPCGHLQKQELRLARGLQQVSGAWPLPPSCPHPSARLALGSPWQQSCCPLLCHAFRTQAVLGRVASAESASACKPALLPTCHLNSSSTLLPACQCGKAPTHCMTPP